MEPAILIENLSKQYKRGADAASYVSLRDVLTDRFKRKETKKPTAFWALNDINLKIAHGERIGIIGRNGAGKSTLLKIISRITPPTKGRVTLEGRVASLLEVGTGFHPELTGRENIYLNGSILGLKRAEINARLNEIIEFSGVENFIDTPLKHYSSGMQLRLAFSVAAHLEPEILMIDEVLAVGDLEFQRKCLGKMDEVSRKDGRTILFVSHNLEAVKHFCNKVVVLENGTIKFEGDVDSGVGFYFQSFETKSTRNKEINFQSLKSTKIIDASVHLDEAQDISLRSLSIDCRFFSHTQQSISFEVIVRDKSYKEIIFAPAGLRNDIKHVIGIGAYDASIHVTLPFLASGNYFVDLLIVESGKKIIDVYQGALKFLVEGTFLSDTGWHFTQNMNQGSVLADAVSAIK